MSPLTVTHMSLKRRPERFKSGDVSYAADCYQELGLLNAILAMRARVKMLRVTLRIVNDWMTAVVIDIDFHVGRPVVSELWGP